MPQDRLDAYEAFVEKLLPGRWGEARPPNLQELKATEILAMRIGEASVKARSGPPSDDDSDDAALDVWAGVVPLTTVIGTPVAAPALRTGIPLPESVERLLDSEADSV